MKTQTLEELKLEARKIKYDLLDGGFKPIQFEMNNSGKKILDKIDSLIDQAGELAVEEFVKVLKNTPYTTKTDNSTSGFIERVIEKANLLKEK